MYGAAEFGGGEDHPVLPPAAAQLRRGHGTVPWGGQPPHVSPALAALAEQQANGCTGATVPLAFAQGAFNQAGFVPICRPEPVAQPPAPAGAPLEAPEGGQPTLDPVPPPAVSAKDAKDLARRDSARLIVPGWLLNGSESWDGKSRSWTHNSHPPETKHLIMEAVVRSHPRHRVLPPSATTNWTKDKLAAWLWESPVLPIEDLCTNADLGLPDDTNTVLHGHNTSGAGVDDPDPDLPCERWSARVHTTRLIHVCVELLDAFLLRDKPLVTRNEVDVGDRNSFWERAAEKFVDRSFTPSVLGGQSFKDLDMAHQVHDLSLLAESIHMPSLVMLHLPLSNLSQVAIDGANLEPSWTAYPATAVRLKEKFTALRAQMSLALANFRLSGMGDVTCEDAVRHSLTVHGSNFADFCRNDAVLMYTYEVFMKYNMCCEHDQSLPASLLLVLPI